jgi:hypothetical protein
MAWYNNRYVCPECRAVWDSDWSCGNDDECPECEARNISPVSSEDLTVVVEPDGDGSWTIRRSPPEAEENPRYVVVGRLNPKKSSGFKFVTLAKAK